MTDPAIEQTADEAESMLKVTPKLEVAVAVTV